MLLLLVTPTKTSMDFLPLTVISNGHTATNEIKDSLHIENSNYETDIYCYCCRIQVNIVYVFPECGSHIKEVHIV